MKLLVLIKGPQVWKRQMGEGSGALDADGGQIVPSTKEA